MPNCFRLIPKGQTEPEALESVDAKICQRFGVPVDPVRWYYDWYYVIRWTIAVDGCNLGSPELRRKVEAWSNHPAYRPEILRILDYLEANYTSDHWVEDR